MGQKRNEWCSILIAKGKEFGYNEITRPNRFGNGNYMTCAIISPGYWLGDAEKTIDTIALVDRLKKYKQFLLECL